VKRIEFGLHAVRSARKRGATEAEVRTAIEQGTWKPAAEGRLCSRFEFAYGGEWHGREYGFKAVEPVFIELRHKIVVVTVYTYFYNRREHPDEDNL